MCMLCVCIYIYIYIYIVCVCVCMFDVHFNITDHPVCVWSKHVCTMICYNMYVPWYATTCMYHDMLQHVCTKICYNMYVPRYATGLWPLLWHYPEHFTYCSQHMNTLCETRASLPKFSGNTSSSTKDTVWKTLSRSSRRLVSHRNRNVLAGPSLIVIVTLAHICDHPPLVIATLAHVCDHPPSVIVPLV